MKKVPFHKIEVIQRVTSSDSEPKEVVRKFKSKSEFKRQMALFGFAGHILYDLEKHGAVSFDFDSYNVTLEMKVLE